MGAAASLTTFDAEALAEEMGRPEDASDLAEEGAALVEVRRLREKLRDLATPTKAAAVAASAPRGVVWGRADDDGSGGDGVGSVVSASSEMAGGACDGLALRSGGSWATSAVHPAGSAEHLEGEFEAPSTLSSVTIRSWNEPCSETRLVVRPAGAAAKWTAATAWAAHQKDATLTETAQGAPLTSLGPIERFRVEARHTRAAASAKAEPPRQRIGCKRLMIVGAVATARDLARAAAAHRIDSDAVPGGATRTVAAGESEPHTLLSTAEVDYGVRATHLEAHGVFFTVRAKKRGPFAIKVRAIHAAAKYGPAQSTVWVHEERRNGEQFGALGERDERMRDIAGCVVW